LGELEQTLPGRRMYRAYLFFYRIQTATLTVKQLLVSLVLYRRVYPLKNFNESKEL